MMLTLLRTTSNHPDFEKLTSLFDEYLIEIDGDEKDFFAQFNQIFLSNVVICYDNEEPAGCGAFKKHENGVVEIKRMFVHPEHRKKGVATLVLNELENWATQLGNSVFILETSFKLLNALAFYKKSGYLVIPNYGQYKNVDNSVCMKKVIK